MNSLLVTFLNEPLLICLHIVKLFQVMLSNTLSSICILQCLKPFVFKVQRND